MAAENQSAPTRPRHCFHCRTDVSIVGKACGLCGRRMLTRLPDALVAQLHYAYCKGATLQELARHPLTRGIGLGRSEAMRVLRLSREFHARRLHVRSSSEAQRKKYDRKRRAVAS